MRNSVNQFVEVEFPINSYHRLIRFRVDVVEKRDAQGKFLDVTVRDRDYKFKVENYWLKEYDL